MVKVNVPVINIRWLICAKDHFICTDDEKSHCVRNNCSNSYQDSFTSLPQWFFLTHCWLTWQQLLTIKGGVQLQPDSDSVPALCKGWCKAFAFLCTLISINVVKIQTDKNNNLPGWFSNSPSTAQQWDSLSLIILYAICWTSKLKWILKRKSSQLFHISMWELRGTVTWAISSPWSNFREYRSTSNSLEVNSSPNV